MQNRVVGVETYLNSVLEWREARAWDLLEEHRIQMGGYGAVLRGMWVKNVVVGVTNTGE